MEAERLCSEHARLEDLRGGDLLRQSGAGVLVGEDEDADSSGDLL